MQRQLKDQSNWKIGLRIKKAKPQTKWPILDNFDIKYEGHQNCLKTLSRHILRVFGHHHMWCQNWCQYVWTSLCQFFLWTSSIVHVFDFLTFDIFLTTWHCFDNLASFWQHDIYFDTWAIGHMGKGVSWLLLQTKMGHLGDGAHGQWAHGHNFLNTWGIFTKI